MKYILAFISFLFVTVLSGQEFPLYRLYNIDEFVKNHFQDSQTFYHAFYSAIKYPAIARENHWEGIMDVLLVNHSDSTFEINVTNDHGHLFLDEIYRTLSWTRKVWLKTDTPFIIKFCIEFTLDALQSVKFDSVRTCNLRVFANSPPWWKDTSYIYSVNEISYLPQIADYPYFINYLPYQPLESIEDLLEIMVKSCFKLSLHLTHLETRESHDRDMYIETHDVIAVIINRKGFISKVGVYGKLVKKIDAETLSNALKKLRFRPALADNKPVNVAIDFRVE